MGYVYSMLLLGAGSVAVKLLFGDLSSVDVWGGDIRWMTPIMVCGLVGFIIWGIKSAVSRLKRPRRPGRQVWATR